MPGIPNEVYKCLRETLLECGPFHNDSQLRAVFANASLAPWQSRIPEANSPTDRVESTIHFLMDKHHSENQTNALILLLEVLRERIDQNNVCYQRLTNLTNDLRDLFHNNLNPAQTNNELAKAATHSQPIRSTIFICYSHEDKKYLRELQTQLSYYIHKDKMNVWDDTKIPAGGIRQAAIEDALQSAKVAVLLISSDFLGSKFILDYELPALLAAQKQAKLTILPVIVRPCAFEETELVRFQPVHDSLIPLARMTKAKREEIWSEIAGIARKTLKESVSLHGQAVDVSLHKISKKSVTETQQLQSILMGAAWPDKLLNKAYKVSMPNGWIGTNTSSSTDLLPFILENLAAAPLQSDGTFPILIFAQYLALYASKHQEISIQNTLNVWMRERTQELELSTNQVKTLHDKVSTYCSPNAYYLLITLDAEDGSNFCMQAWLMDNEDNIISNAGVEVENESISLEQVPFILNLLLEKCGDYLADEIEKLIIEFVLPNKLLCYPVDHWLVDNGMASVKLGIQHKVVVRSLERLHGRRIWPWWKNKWKELQKLLDGDPVLTNNRGPVWIYSEDQYGTDESLYAELRRSSVVCLALTFAPLDNLTSRHDVLRVAIGAGIPIILWPRTHTDNPTSASDLFTSLLLPETLLEIPTLVWKQRLTAAESKDEYHQGHHLTLLWDDPNRLPPIANAVQFAMPSARKGA